MVLEIVEDEKEKNSVFQDYKGERLG